MISSNNEIHNGDRTMIYRQLVEELEAKKQQTRSAEIALYKRKLALSVAKKEYAREKAQV